MQNYVFMQIMYWICKQSFNPFFLIMQAIMAFVSQERMHDDNDVEAFADVGC